MKKKIVAICENKESARALKLVEDELGLDIICEIQDGISIENEVSQNDIKDAIAILFVIEYEVEEIEKIERFIDYEYYEVEPKYVIENAKSVVNEIISDIN